MHSINFQTVASSSISLQSANQIKTEHHSFPETSSPIAQNVLGRKISFKRGMHEKKRIWCQKFHTTATRATPEHKCMLEMEIDVWDNSRIPITCGASGDTSFLLIIIIFASTHTHNSRPAFAMDNADWLREQTQPVPCMPGKKLEVFHSTHFLRAKLPRSFQTKPVQKTSLMREDLSTSLVFHLPSFSPIPLSLSLLLFSFFLSVSHSDLFFFSFSLWVSFFFLSSVSVRSLSILRQYSLFLLSRFSFSRDVNNFNHSR